MPFSHRPIRPHRLRPAKVRQLQMIRRRRRMEWTWFGLVVSGLLLAYGIAGAVQWHSSQVELSRSGRNNPRVAARERDSEIICPIRSGASVAPLRSIAALSDLNHSTRSDSRTRHDIPTLIGDDARSEIDHESAEAEPDIPLLDRAEMDGKANDTPDAMFGTTVEFNGTLQVSQPPARPLKYDLFLPASGAREAPLVLLLHGSGGNRSVWNRWAAEAQARGWIVCLPIATDHRRWAEVDVTKLRDLALQLVQTLGGDGSRIAIFGYSNGGFFAYEAALRNPDVFFAAVSIGGGCNVFQFSEASKRVGAYFIHGTVDRAVPVAVARASAERLTSAGVTRVVLKEYPGRGHAELFESEIQPVFVWLDGLN